jgi:hypothetical protein
VTATDALAKTIDFAAEAILDAAQLDGLPLMGKLWTLRVEDDAIVLRIRAARVNGSPVPRQPPPPPPTPKPKPTAPPTKPAK